MISEPRLYRDESDLEKACQLLISGRQAQNGTYYVHTGDLKWWIYYPPFGEEHRDYFYLWDDPDNPGRILAWCLLSLNGYFDLYVQPELHGTELAREMFTWAEAQAVQLALQESNKQINIMWVSQADEWLCQHLQMREFRRIESYISFKRCLNEWISTPRLADHFVVRGSLGEVEVGSRALAQYGSFNNQVPFERYEERFLKFMRSPVYNPDLDVVAVAPDGQIGSFCIVWIDPINKVGLFEPVGTHPDFQRKGLGKAVMLEALHRLRELGMQTAIVCTPENNLPGVRLYESVGFQQVDKLGIYEKGI